MVKRAVQSRLSKGGRYGGSGLGDQEEKEMKLRSAAWTVQTKQAPSPGDRDRRHWFFFKSGTVANLENKSCSFCQRK